MKEVLKTNKLTIHQNEEQNQLVLVFKGVIDEDFNISEVMIDKKTTVSVDFDKLEQINSCGIRQFISFMGKYLDGTNISYINCPSYLVYQMSLVAGFIAPNRKIKSFYVPYYSDEKDSDTMVKFDLSSLGCGPTEVQAKLANYKDADGTSYEFDGFIDKFFQFLKLQ
jgi:hypothetical protein